MKSTILLRLWIVNSIGIAIVAALSAYGVVLPSFLSDVSYLSYAIVVLFVFGTFRVISFAKDLTKYNFYIASEKILEERYSSITDVGEYLVTLGLLGTAIGILVAISGIDLSSVGTAEGALKISAEMAVGMKTAIYTTIIGGFTWMWHTFNCRLIHTEMVAMFERTRR